MTNQIINQLALTRRALINDIEKLDTKVYNEKPKGIRNNILWQVGHILTVTEQFYFGIPQGKLSIPENYIELYKNGSKPADWPEEVPSMDELLGELKSQLDRIQALDDAYFEANLEKEFLGQKTVGGLASFATYHEANHIGQIHAMNLMLK